MTRKRRRRIPRNWTKEILKGNIKRFYGSADWRDVREQALKRDRYECQFYNGNFTQREQKPDRLRLVKATTVHHIKPIKQFPELALDLNNLVSLSHEAHEIIEGRWRFSFKTKEPLTKERW